MSVEDVHWWSGASNAKYKTSRFLPCLLKRLVWSARSMRLYRASIICQKQLISIGNKPFRENKLHTFSSAGWRAAEESKKELGMFPHTRADWAREMKKAEKPRDRHKAAPSMIFSLTFILIEKNIKWKLHAHTREKSRKGLGHFQRVGGFNFYLIRLTFIRNNIWVFSHITQIFIWFHAGRIDTNEHLPFSSCNQAAEEKKGWKFSWFYCGKGCKLNCSCS